MDILTKALEQAIAEQDWLTLATLIIVQKIGRDRIVDILEEVYLQGGQADQP